MKSDTSPTVQAHFDALLARRSPAERLEMACRMFDTAKALVLAGIRSEGITDPVEIRRQLFLRFYGNDFSEAERDRILAALLSR